MIDWAAEVRVVGEVALAALLGGLVGLERELRGKSAGLRTHMTVAAAAALLVSLGRLVVRSYAAHLPPEALRTDPLRAIEAIITGVSFLGAGMIFFRREQGRVHGLTTAASLLLVVGIGVAVAVEDYVLAVSLTVLILLILAALTPVERWIDRRRRGRGEPPVDRSE